MNSKYLECLATMELTTYHYKILLLLNIKAFTQSQISTALDIQRQNTNKYFKELEACNLIEIDRTEGRNTFYKAVTNTRSIKSNIKNQLKLECL